MASAENVNVREVKLCLLGTAGVGKSSLVNRFAYGVFTENYATTNGASFVSKTVSVDGQAYKLQIWDTAGQEKFRGLAPMYYRGAAIALLVYDITYPPSFEDVRSWYSELNQMNSASEGVVLVIVGNKSDVAEKRQVATEDGEDYANSINAIFLEASARTGANVQQIFDLAVRKLPPLPAAAPAVTKSVTLTETSGTAKKGCC